MSLRKLDQFLRGDFRRLILERYHALEIVSEADLQAHAYHLISSFLRSSREPLAPYKVLNKPFMKNLRIHPDLVIFRKTEPWVVLELKRRRRRLSKKRAAKERDRIIRMRTALGAKRGYLVYVAGRGKGKLLRGMKEIDSRFFCEIPITLSSIYSEGELAEWEGRFRKWAKYTRKDH